MQARYVIDLGASWRIGSGESILIRDDKWLPKHPPARIVSPPVTLPLESKVSALIDEVNYYWRSDLIQTEFLAHEADLILGIPLSCQSIQDEHIWFNTSNGKYSTRSAYHLIVGIERHLSPRCSDLEKNHILWKGV